MQFTPKNGINKWWQAFYFSNSRFRIASVKLNGVQLDFTKNNFWIHDDKVPSSPLIFELFTYGGNSVTFEADSLFEEQDTGVQFKSFRRIQQRGLLEI